MFIQLFLFSTTFFPSLMLTLSQLFYDVLLRSKTFFYEYISLSASPPCSIVNEMLVYEINKSLHCVLFDILKSIPTFLELGLYFVHRALP